MNRTRDFYRKQRIKHINRKKRIIKNLGFYYKTKFDGMLAKGKIHCSCYYCSNKTKYRPSYSDRKKIEKIIFLEEEYAQCS